MHYAREGTANSVHCQRRYSKVSLIKLSNCEMSKNEAFKAKIQRGAACTCDKAYECVRVNTESSDPSAV